MLSLTKNLGFKLVVPIFRASAIKGAPMSTTFDWLADHTGKSTVGPYPRTKEERERAAKKYNLIPEDYEPHEEGDALGDYPKLKAIGPLNRDPYDDFDDPYDMRFYGEVFHRDADLYYWERIDPLAHEKQHVPVWLQTLIFVSLPFILPTLYYLFKRYKIQINQPWKIRTYHPAGQKYYHFPSPSDH